MQRQKLFDDFSKDIPNLQTTWSANSLGTFKECPRKYYYQKVLGLRRKARNVHLDFGAYYADCIELYHREKVKEGGTHESALLAATRKALGAGTRDAEGVFQPWVSEDQYKNRSTLVRAVVWYLDKFEHDPAQTVILSNGQPAVELEFKMGIGVEAPDGIEYSFSGYLDRLATLGSDVYVVDNKTTKSQIGSNYFAQYNPNNQMSLYTLAGSVVFGARVRGVIIDACQLAVGFARFGRDTIHRTESQLQEWLADSIRWLRRAEVCAQEQHWPMNDTACDKYGGCPFRSVCGAAPGVRELYLKTDFEQRSSEPTEEDAG